MTNFLLRRLTVRFRASAPILFPVTMAANLLRGALGSALPHHLFAPGRLIASPSGLAAPPRPFVIRARHLNSRRFLPGQTFSVTLHLFGPFSADILAAFRESPPFHGGAQLIGSHEESLALPLLPPPGVPTAQPQAVTVQFLTPTELKLDSGLAPLPEFPVLFARALTRLRTLAVLYSSELVLPYEELTQVASAVILANHQLTHEWAERRSTRTGQTHPLGGFTGTATYSGPVHHLLPILHAACFTGIGRQTVWGKGEIAVVKQSP